MNSELKELIEISCVTGNLAVENKNLIYTKAEEFGIAKEECDIYISGFLAKANNSGEEINNKTHVFGYMLYFGAFWDTFWGLSLTKYGFTKNYVVWILIFGAIMFYFSFRLMKKNSVTTKILAIILLSLVSMVSTIAVFRFLFGLHTNAFVLILSGFLTMGIIILFKRIFLTEKYAVMLEDKIRKIK